MGSLGWARDSFAFQFANWDISRESQREWLNGIENGQTGSLGHWVTCKNGGQTKTEAMDGHCENSDSIKSPLYLLNSIESRLYLLHSLSSQRISLHHQLRLKDVQICSEMYKCPSWCKFIKIPPSHCKVVWKPQQELFLKLPCSCSELLSRNNLAPLDKS